MLSEVLDEIHREFKVNVYALPSRDVVVTWKTVLQCMYGCRVYSNFSRRWSCVPFCIDPNEARSVLGKYETALILSKKFKPPIFNVTWVGFNPLRDLNQKIWATRCYGEMNRIALQVEKMLEERNLDVYCFGMSPCHVCIKCTYPNKCKVPGKLRFSADACGIDIYATCRKVGCEFEVPPRRFVNLFEFLLVNGLKS